MTTFFLSVFLLLVSQLNAQPPLDHQGSNFRARRAFERGMEAYHSRDFQLAIELVERAIKRAPHYVLAHMLRAEIYFEMHMFDQSAGAYEMVVGLSPDAFSQAYYYLGISYLKTGEYFLAKQRFSHFLSLTEVSGHLRSEAEVWLRHATFALDAKQNPVPFDPYNLGPGVNTVNAEYSPAITADANTMVFTRRIPRQIDAPREYGREVENFYVSHRVGEEWMEATDIGPPINTSRNEGAQSLSIDGRSLYFTGCNRPDGHGSCDIYLSVRIGDRWGVPQNLGSVVNSAYWDSQPSISANGKDLYFTSARRGGYGETDIWVTSLDENGNWQQPRNLGPLINTRGREMSPFIHPDNTTLYFVSDRHPGMGGLDLFYSKRDENGEWRKPVNLGYPINSHADEFSLVVDASGEMAYFASDKPGGFGNMDIYGFRLYEGVRPAPMTYMRGRVYDRENGQALEALFELTDLQTGNPLLRSSSDVVTGEFLVVVPLNTEVALNVSRPGYLFYSAYFNYTEIRTTVDPHLEDIALTPVRAGEPVVLNNVFFETASAELSPASRTELQRLTMLLTENPDLQIEVRGHTDSTGSHAFNLELSENRAGSVVRFLIRQGIDPSRMSYKGYADTMPVDTNDTAEGRARNRRTEFIVLDKKEEPQ